jgi:HEPN domain-containing protein
MIVKNRGGQMSTRKKSAQSMLKEISSSEQHITAAHFRQSAFMDYLAARVLLLDKMPLQALISASTCIEKYLKAILATKGKVTKTHLDSEDFYKIFEIEGFDVHTYVNENFVRYLGRSYDLRYIEAKSESTSVAVETRKLLAELDELVSEFEKRLVFRQGGIVTSTNYQNVTSTYDQRIWRENHVLCEIDKAEYVQTPGLLWVIAVRKMNTSLELQHQDYRALADGNFDFPKVRFTEPDQIHVEFSEANGPDRALSLGRQEGQLLGFR